MRVFVTKDEIRQIANEIIIDEVNNDILFIVANKGFGKYRLIEEIYGTHYNESVIIVNGQSFNSDSMVKNCLMHGIFEFLRRNNTRINRNRLCNIVSNCGKKITFPRRLSFDVHIKINKAEMESLLEPLSIHNLIDVYDEFSNNTPLVLFLKGTELNENDEYYLKHAKSGRGGARITFIVALRPDESGIQLIKKVCQIRDERVWICPLLPAVKDQVANQKIIDIPAILISDVQDSSSYHDFKKSVGLKDYYNPVFELVSELLTMNINPSMIFTIANQEILKEDFRYINDIAKRLLHEPSASPNCEALVPHDEKYVWIDALAYYIFVNEGIEELFLEMQKFYFSFLVDISYWKDSFEKNGYRYDIAAVLNMSDRNRMNDFLKKMSHVPNNPLIPEIADYTSRLSNWIRTFSRPAVNEKVHCPSMAHLVNELFSFCIGFSDVNIEALHIISNETGHLGSLDIALLITANKLRNKTKLSKTEQSAVDKLVQKSLEEMIRWNDITLAREVCDVLILLKQLDCLNQFFIPTITNNHVIYQCLKDMMIKYKLNERELFMGRKTIFISYTNSDIDIVNIIDTYLSECGYDVHRDTRDIGDYTSIETFMNGIRKNDFVVPIVSDTYLRRNNCMYEIAQLIKDANYTERTFPVVIDLPKTETRSYTFFHPLYRAEIINFWVDETQKLRDAIDTLPAENRGELDNEIRRYTNYTQSIASFMDWFKSYLVGLVPNEVKKLQREQIALEIAKKIDSTIISKST